MFGSLSLRTVSAISGNALLSEAAAKTLSSTGSVAVVVAAGAAVVDVEEDVPAPPEHDERAIRLNAAMTAIPLKRFIGSLRAGFEEKHSLL